MSEEYLTFFLFDKTFSIKGSFGKHCEAGLEDTDSGLLYCTVDKLIRDKK